MFVKLFRFSIVLLEQIRQLPILKFWRKYGSQVGWNFLISMNYVKYSFRCQTVLWRMLSSILNKSFNNSLSLPILLKVWINLTLLNCACICSRRRVHAIYDAFPHHVMRLNCIVVEVHIKAVGFGEILWVRMNILLPLLGGGSLKKKIWNFYGHQFQMKPTREPSLFVIVELQNAMHVNVQNLL